MVAESRVLPSPLAPRSFTLTSLACAMPAAAIRMRTESRLLRLGDFEDGTVELLAARRRDAIAHEPFAADGFVVGDVGRVGDVEFADVVLTFRIEPARF